MSPTNQFGVTWQYTLSIPWITMLSACYYPALSGLLLLFTEWCLVSFAEPQSNLIGKHLSMNCTVGKSFPFNWDILISFFNRNSDFFFFSCKNQKPCLLMLMANLTKKRFVRTLMKLCRLQPEEKPSSLGCACYWNERRGSSVGRG